MQVLKNHMAAELYVFYNFGNLYYLEMLLFKKNVYMDITFKLRKVPYSLLRYVTALP